jgi:putative endonuclease
MGPLSRDEKRLLASEHGRAAEAAVAGYLRERGFDIVALNLRIGRYEIDVVARQGPLIVVVEVRTRGKGAWTTGFGSLDAGKRRRIRLAGERLWDRRYAKDVSAERLRFDAASVTFENGVARVEYAPGAF